MTEPASTRYDNTAAGRIEAFWQAEWERAGAFHADNPVGGLAGAGAGLEPFFIMDMFPYPSGDGLHVGHPLGFIATDVLARFQRMAGKNVLHTMGFDSFGLPTEIYAVQTGIHPAKVTDTNVARFLQQIRRLGLGHDERRRFNTSDPDYYRWTQWIFLKIYNAWYDQGQKRARPVGELEAEFASGARATSDGRAWGDLTKGEQRALVDSYRLVGRHESVVNWCPGLGTVLSNEEVTDEGRSERGNFPVFRKNLRQWTMRITEYADRLVDDLDRLDWPDKVKSMQRNWIGRSTGAVVAFEIAGDRRLGALEVFTTRPDTLYGVTFMVAAPESELVDALVPDQWPEGTSPEWTGGAATPAEAVAAYRAKVANRGERERQEEKTKTGVFTGAFAVNPITEERIPLFVADYVLVGYGTGVVMAVPGHDQRDWEFAKTFGLPVAEVVSGGDVETGAHTGDGKLVNSGAWDGLSPSEAKAVAAQDLERRGVGRAQLQYKLRDWLFARQRYWGEPFPLVADSSVDQVFPLGDAQLPVLLPEIEDFRPIVFEADDADSRPSAPLKKAGAWLTTEFDFGDGLKPYTRETDVMPNWAGSCWYYLRYLDPKNEETFCDPANEHYWIGPKPEKRGAADPGGVDLYVGGTEHAVLHLLYARFWHKVLHDLGEVSSAEPFRRLFNQGYIQAASYTDSRGAYVPAAEVEERGGEFFWTDSDGTTQPVKREFGKMGKSLKNSVTPDEICAEYGADTLRVYEMSMGPLDQSKDWSTKDIVGAQRFLARVWRLVVDEDGAGKARVAESEPDVETLRVLHRTIAQVGEDYPALKFNLAVAKLIEYTNHLTKRYLSDQQGPDGAPRAAVEPLVVMLAPLAPHLAEELWRALGHEELLVRHPFPAVDPKFLVDDEVRLPVQIGGKVRATIVVPAEAAEDVVRAAALADPKVVEQLAGKEPKRVIVVPKKMVSIVL
ncbi:MAG: leucine--tRNA ligase [Segniliparus sp.]|uniref:leucine--tRNA ligase n=1 Tax=Segniliparus sp. TaxID=2804064 RepID=UPI003F2A7943